MQYNLKNEYKVLAKELGRNENLVRDFTNFIFKELKEKQNDPPNLILRLKGIGRFFLRYTKLKNKKEELENHYKYKEGINPGSTTLYDRNYKIYETISRLLPIYEDFLNRKKEIRKERVKNGFTREMIIYDSLPPDTLLDTFEKKRLLDNK